MHFPGNFTTTFKTVFLTLPTFYQQNTGKNSAIYTHTYVNCLHVNSVGLQRKINEKSSEEAAPEAAWKLPGEPTLSWQALVLCELHQWAPSL